MTKVVLSGAIVGVVEQDLIAALSSVANKHFGTSTASLVAALGEAAAAAANTAAKVDVSDTAAKPVTITTNGTETAQDTLIEGGADLAIVEGQSEISEHIAGA